MAKGGRVMAERARPARRHPPDDKLAICRPPVAPGKGAGTGSNVESARKPKGLRG
jgi:hypothetical protein